MVEMKREDKTAFWKAVEECLVRFHGLNRRSARQKIHDLRARLKDAPTWIDGRMIFHMEPFDLACDLTGHNVDFEKHRGEYLEILEAAS